MKKTLYEIFDEASPCELDRFSNELTAFDPENAVLSSVKNKVYAKLNLADCENEKGRIMIMKKDKKLTRIRKSLLASAACLAMVLGCFAGYHAFFKQPTSDSDVISDPVQASVATIVTLDVNPSLEIKADEEEKVVQVVALNQDAETVMGNMELEGNSLELTVNALVGSMLQKGYINETANSILISVENGDEKIGTTIKDKLSAKVSALISTESIEGSVISQIVSGEDKVLSELASRYGITLGKAKLIQTIVKMIPDSEFSDYAELSISELNTFMNTSAEDPKDDSIYIGEQRAIEIALNKLNLTVDALSSEPTVKLVATRGEICYLVEVSRAWQDEDGAHSALYVIYVNAFTGSLSGEGVTEPNFSIEEAWGFVCNQLGSEAENAKLLMQSFNDIESNLPMTYSFCFEVGGEEYTALVDAMNGTVIRITKL